ncbi:hypothetical protein SRHO_G00191860 [Serrasalmus rhombeus]
MKMLAIFGILLMFTEAGVGLLSMNPVCRFNQSDPCYGAVGRPLYLQLPSEDEIIVKKNISGASTYIFRFKRHKITQNHPDYPRWQFVADNRTMITSSAEKRDSGRYTLDTYHSTGTLTGVYYLQLVIEDVVSSVTVTDSCLSIVKRNVYCSSDGDNVHYNLTFLQTHQRADGSQTLLLDKEAHGSVTRYAQNHVSHEKKTIEIQQCPVTYSTTVTTTATFKTKVTQRTQSGKGTSLAVTDRTSNPQVHLRFQTELLLLTGEGAKACHWRLKTSCFGEMEFVSLGGESI